MRKVCFVLLCLFRSSYATPPHDSTPLMIPTVIKSSQQAVLSSEMAGKIIDLGRKEGQSFNKGDRLITFDCAIDIAQQKKGEAEFVRAKKYWHSFQRLAQLGTHSDTELADSFSNFKKAEADKEIAQKKVSFCTVMAPFSGYVKESFVQQYETVQLHQRLIEIVADDSLTVEALVPSKWLSWLKPGEKFRVIISETEKSYPATIARIVKHVNAISQTVKVIATIENPNNELHSGMSGKSIFEKN